MKEDEKKRETWELEDPKPPVIHSERASKPPREL